MTVTNITGQVHEIGRHLATTERDGQTAWVATITRTYPTTVEDLWEALTSPERLDRWFARVTGELREGGRYAIEGNADGTIERCEPPHGFSATWEFGGQTSWIEVAVEEVADAARFTLVHTAHVPDEFWQQYGPGATGVGWDLSLLGLGLHLQNPAWARPQEDTFTLDGEGRAFTEASSRLWVEAAIAAGEPEEAARAAGERTTAFYTGSA
jgi:uncharacterized protein YndB with AHSA1/START domain